MIGSWLAYASASNPDKLPYDLSFWRAGASAAGTALSGLLAHRHSRAALPVAGVTSVGTMVLGAMNKRLRGSYVTRTWDTSSWRETAFNRVMPVVHAFESVALVGLVTFSRIKSRSSSIPPMEGPLFSVPWYPLARKLGLYFMGFSLLGHWVEMAFCTGIKYGVFKGGYDRSNHMLWDQWLFPFPAEGTAAVLADLVLTPAKNAVQGVVGALSEAGKIPASLATPLALGASFLINQVVCTSVDYGTGMVANRNYELWDYRDMRFHFQGQVCLQNSLFYSIIATWGVWWLLPALEKLIARTSDSALDCALFGFGSFYAFLCMLYFTGTQGDKPSEYTEIE